MVAGPLAELVAQVADGRLRPIEGHTYPLSRRPARARGPARPQDDRQGRARPATGWSTRVTASVDPEFLALPLDACADAGLARAAELGASHADLRVVALRTSMTNVRDARLDGAIMDSDSGLAVRVIVDGCWGFAASDVIGPDTARDLAERAVAMARISAPLVDRSRRARSGARARRHLGVGVRHRPVRGARGRAVRGARRAQQRPAGPRRGEPRRRGADAGEGAGLLRRPRRHPHHAAARAPAGRVERRRGRRGERGVRDDVHHSAPGGARLGVRGRRRARGRREPAPGTGTTSWAAWATTWPRRCWRRRSSPAATTSSSTRRTCGSRSTSRSATPPSSTALSATRPTTPARRSPRPTSSARCATAPTSCT